MDATGEAEAGPLRLQFDRSIKLAFCGSSISSDGGLLLHRELDDALGLTDLAAGLIGDPRTGRNGRHRLAGFLRQSVFSRLAGYEDVNDADRLCRDPVMRQLVGGRAVKNGAASASAMGRFETEMLTSEENLDALTGLSGRWIDAVHDKRPQKVITLDMDSSESPVHGDQEGAMWNGHFQSKCLHPLFVFNEFGDLERCALRPGNVHSADGWEGVLKPVLARCTTKARPSITRRRFRADAAFAIPALFDLLEAEGWDYAIRLKSNPKLHERIDWLTRRGPGRPPNHAVRHYTGFHYRAKSWSKPRRVVAKVEFHPGELFPTVGFIVTNRSLRLAAFKGIKRDIFQQVHIALGLAAQAFPFRDRVKPLSHQPRCLSASLLEGAHLAAWEFSLFNEPAIPTTSQSTLNIQYAVGRSGIHWDAILSDYCFSLGGAIHCGTPSLRIAMASHCTIFFPHQQPYSRNLKAILGRGGSRQFALSTVV